MYDVHYLDCHGAKRVLASGLTRPQATSLARAEARNRRVGRMFLAGSERGAIAHAVVIIDRPPATFAETA